MVLSLSTTNNAAKARGVRDVDQRQAGFLDMENVASFSGFSRPCKSCCGKEEDPSRAAPDFSNDHAQALAIDGSHESSNTLVPFPTHVTHMVPCAGVPCDCSQRL